MEPITRQEQFLAKMGGQNVSTPKPLTREEQFYQQIIENGGVGGSGGTSIDVTASVGQTIVVKAVDENGKPTEWESAEYQPRTHYEELVEILPETTVEVAGESGASAILPDITLEGGKEYTVKYNGTEYVSICVDTGNGFIGIGNLPLLMETGDNGQPFVIGIETGDCILMTIDAPTSVTLSIVRNDYMPIPVQYVTNALPYYIEVTGSGTTDDPYVCNDTVANVTERYNSGRQLVIRIDREDNELLFPINQTGTTDYDMSYVAFLPYALQAVIGHNVIMLFAQEDGTFDVRTHTLTLD